MVNRKQTQREAAISFLTVIILSILLSVITTGFVRLMTTYQRESINEDLSNRAYYAAQAGFEDAVRVLKTGDITDSKTSCKPYKIPYENKTTTVDSVSVANASSGIDAAYTCSTINLTPSTQSRDNLKANQAVVFHINPEDSTIKNFRINITWWSSPGVTSASGTIYSDHRVLPSPYEWQNKSYPAMMRSSLVAFSDTDVSKYRITSFYNNPRFVDNFTPSADLDPIDWRPTTNNDVNPSVDFPASSTNSSYGVQTVAECVVNERRCKAIYDIKKLENKAQVFLVLRPIYRAVDSVEVSIQELTTSGSGQGSHSVITTASPSTFAGGQAAIDITGRAGNVYRRIQQTVPYGKYPSGLLSDFPDFALVAGDGLCKQITVGTNASSFKDECQ